MPEPFVSEGVQGTLDRPEAPNGHAVALAHGAGSNSNAPVLVFLSRGLVAAGYTVLRYDLPFRQHRPKGPPFPAMAARDRQGIAQAVAALRGLGCQRTFAGGHSYGGRQTAMASAEDLIQVDGLVLLSYPLHPPQKPDQMRTTFFPEWRTPALFVHGTADSFGSPVEMRAALSTIPAPVELAVMEGSGHDLRRGDVAGAVVTWLSARH